MAEDSPQKRARVEASEVGSASTPGQVELYSYWRSSCSWRVRIALQLKGVEYAYHAVHLVKNEQFGEDYVHKNKFRQVPTLIHSGHVLTQSPAIIEYIDETFPGHPLLPKDAVARAHARELAAMIGCDTQPVQNLRVLRHLASVAPGDDAERTKAAWAKHFIELGFSGLEKALQETAGRYCLGDHVTLPDLFLVPQVYNAKRFGVNMDDYPTIKAIDEHLSTLPEFHRAHPAQQPDADK